MARLDVDVDVIVKGLQELERIGGGLDEAGQKASKFGAVGTGVMQGVGQAAFGLGASIVKAGIDAGVEAIGNSIDLASDKAEAASKVNVLFGDSARYVHEASEDAATAVGLSSGEYLVAAGNVGNLVTNLGFAGDQAATMSTDIVALSADLGSFNNAPTAEVVEAIGAAFRGESEPIRRFGVMLDEATIKAKAMELGLYEGTGAIDKTAKATATYQLILEQTSAAQGDFARTADGLANSQKIANARIDDALTGLGEKLMPIVADLVPLIADGLVGAIDLASDLFDDLGPLIDTVVGALRFLVDIVGTTVDVLHDLHRAIAPNMAALEDIETEFRATAEAAGLTADEIDDAWQQAVASSQAGGAATTASMDEWIASYQAGQDQAATTAAAQELAADRAVASATRIAQGADDMADAFATAGERIPAAVQAVADQASMAEALASRSIDDMPGAANRIAASIRAELSSERIRGQALAAAEAIGRAVPGEIADGLIERSREVLDAADRLVELLKNGLTPEQQAIRLIGRDISKLVGEGIRSAIPGAAEAALQLAVTSINTIEDAGLQGAKGVKGMREIGQLYDQLLASGMTAAEARVALAAGGVANATIDTLEGKGGAFENAGSSIAASWVQGIAERLRSKATQSTIDRAIGIATRAMQAHSPPDTGPLRHIDSMGDAIGSTWVQGIIDGISGSAGQLTGSLGGLLTGNSLGSLAPAGAGAAGGIVVNVYAGVGDPVEIGRQVSEALRAYQRSSGEA